MKKLRPPKGETELQHLQNQPYRRSNPRWGGGGKDSVTIFTSYKSIFLKCQEIWGRWIGVTKTDDLRENTVGQVCRYYTAGKRIFAADTHRPTQTNIHRPLRSRRGGRREKHLFIFPDRIGTNENRPSRLWRDLNCPTGLTG